MNCTPQVRSGARTIAMKKIYDVLLKEAIARKSWIEQLWDSADNTKSGFM